MNNIKVQTKIMNQDFKTIKPIWFIEKDTLVTILQVIKNLDEDLKRKIITIITLINKKKKEIRELKYNEHSFHNEINMINFEFIQIEEYYSE